MMTDICDLKINYAPNSESNSKNGNTLHKDNLIRSQNEKYYFEEKKTKREI